MLDIYELRDDEDTPDVPDESRHLGSLSLDDFRILRPFFDRCQEEGIAFGPFADARMLSGQVKEMLVWAIDLAACGNPVAWAPLLDVLRAGAGRDAGIMAFAD